MSKLHINSLRRACMLMHGVLYMCIMYVFIFMSDTQTDVCSVLVVFAESGRAARTASYGRGLCRGLASRQGSPAPHSCKAAFSHLQVLPLP